MQERRGQTFRVVTLTIDLPKDSDATKIARARQLADTLVRQARAGQSINALARANEREGVRASTLDAGATMAFGGFGKPMDDAVARLDAGEVSEPFVTGTVLTIVKVTDRQASQIPPYVEVRDVVASRVREEQINKQVRAWLDELKRGVHIEVRL